MFEMTPSILDMPAQSLSKGRAFMYAGSQQVSILWFEKRYIMNFYSAIQENYSFRKDFFWYIIAISA